MFHGWRTALLITILLLVAGCSGNDHKAEEKAVPADSTVKEEAPAETIKKQKEPSEQMGDLNAIKQVHIPKNLEELRAQPAGLFTKDIPYETETKQTWGNFGLGDYKEKLTDKLASIAAETNDPEMIFKALHYYIGSNAYEKAIRDLENFSVEWYEPYLPEPEDMNEQGEETTDPGKALLLLDSSSSMLLNVEGEQKMAVAKTAAGRFANTIGEIHDVSLIVYGHAGSQSDADKTLSCTTIDEVYPLQKFDAEKFTKAVNGVEAKGWTPLAEAIKTAREKMAGSTDNVTLYIISDGAETCGGDPIAEAKAFAAENAGRKVNIIGFDVDTQGENSLKEVAAAGNGEYISAKTIEELDNSIKKTWVPSFIDVMSKSNSLLKHWGQSFDEMVEREGLASKIHYSTLNETSRFYSAMDMMRSEKMITPEIYEDLKERINAKRDLSVKVKNELSKDKLEQIEADRQIIVDKVNDWTTRMNELRKSQGGW